MQSKIIDGKLHYWYSALKHWDKNEKARITTEENWNKFVADVRKNGIEDPFKVDGNDFVIYDGNGRFDIVTDLIENQGITHASNGKELGWIPVDLRYPETEAQKWRIALVNGNSQWRSWDREGLNNFLPEFEDELDLPLINISFYDPKSIEEQIMDAADEAVEQEKPEKKEKTLQCPSCGHEFTPE